MSKVLFIAYNFPPSGGPSVQRSLKFVKYLPHFDWHPIVLTADPSVYPIKDPGLEGDVPPGTPVYRLRSLDWNAWQPAFYRWKLGKLHALLNTLLALPDPAVFWSFTSREAAASLIEKHQPSLVYTTSGPYSAHLLGLWIKRRYNLPWVADFRDPWSQNRLLRYPPGYRQLNRGWERAVLANCDRVLTVSEPFADDLKRLMPNPAIPLSVIPNGYDPDDVPFFDPEKTDRLRFTSTGKFTRLRHPGLLVQAVVELVDRGDIPIQDMEWVFAGSNLDAFIPNHPPFVKLGYLPHKELPQVWKCSNALLLIQDPTPASAGEIGAKLYEYLAANRPILAIGYEHGAAAELIRSTRAGVIINHSLAEIKKAILDTYQVWKVDRLHHDPDWATIRQYSRRELTWALARLFQEVANS